MGLCVAKQNSLSSTQLAFSAKFPKNRRFCLPWSTIDLVNRRRRPTPARHMKWSSDFGSLLLAVDFY